MAEAVILSVVTKIGIALGNEAVKEASLQLKMFITQLAELRDRMGRIKTELRLIHGFLCQVDVRNRKNHNYETWVQELRMAAHRIEDIVDEYLHLVGHKQDTGWGTYLKKWRKRKNLLLLLNRLASSVMVAEDNLVHLFQAKQRWVSMVGSENSVDSSYIVERSQHLASISRSLDEEDLVGVDTNRKQLEQWLAGNDMERSVIALHGIGGLGKTALAANVFRKEREKFECHAWVSISQTYSIKDVLKCLVTDFDKERKDTTGNMDTERLQDELKRFLENKKYLIVLDDVWAPEVVNYLFAALGQNQKGSRVIVTTRIDGVAYLASDDRRIRLEGLQEQDSEELFRKMVFSREINQKCPTELKELAHEIVVKCKGIPLAIVTVGKLLFVRDKTKEEFKRICVQLDWELVNNPSWEDVRNILYLSFIYLPTCLKSCFLHCSLFPEDYLFHRKKFVRLWVAEGFVEERGGSTLEEVAEGYLAELVSRNMLQLVERNSFCRMKKFRMHDILRELAVDLCKKDCFGVTYEEDKRGGSVEMDGHRLVVHKLNKDIQELFSNVHRLRTFVTLDSAMPSLTLLSQLSNKSRYMTVLELSGLPIVKIPDAIGDLFNLRHLGLRGSKVKLLPKSVEKLLNLLTLDLCRSEIEELPGWVVKLKKLRHLFAEKVKDPSWRNFQWRSGVCIPNGIGSLTNLQTLQSLEAQDESIGKLGELRQLRSLRIWNVKGFYCEHLSESLVQMRFLSYLSVNASDENEVLLFSVLPPNLQKLSLRGRLVEGALDECTLFQAVAEQNLYKLGLYWSQLREDPLPSLSRLSNLTELFFTRAYNGEQLAFLSGWFPKLKILRLNDLPNLKKLEIQQGAMVALEKLALTNLSSMTEVPPGLELLMPLQYLFFGEITSDFLTSLRRCSATRGRFWYSPRP